MSKKGKAQGAKPAKKRVAGQPYTSLVVDRSPAVRVALARLAKNYGSQKQGVQEAILKYGK